MAPGAALAKWPEESAEKKVEPPSNYLKLIFWLLTVCMGVIISGGAFFITLSWEKITSMEFSLSQMNERGKKLSSRMAFIEVVNRELAEKAGLNLKTLESVRDLQERDAK